MTRSSVCNDYEELLITRWEGTRRAPDLQSMSSAWPFCPSSAMSWSMMPQGTPAKLCSAR